MSCYTGTIFHPSDPQSFSLDHQKCQSLVATNDIEADTPIKTGIYGSDSASLDSFGRWRVSNPSFVFDAQFTYDLQPLLFQQLTAESGAAIAHDSTNRNAVMTFAATPSGGEAYMQSYEHFRYQAGRSQLCFITFNFIEVEANTKKFAGYGDDNNGIFLEQDGDTVQLTLRSGTDNGDQTVTQEDWNLDHMDGEGASRYNLDLTQAQILVIDFQALYVGRVRVGFDIDGVVYYVHEFLHANATTKPYIQTANLPIRVGMTCSGTSSTTMNFNCSSVISEGGEIEIGGYNLSVSGAVTAGNNTRTHLLSIRPKTTFNSIVNRIKLVLQNIHVLVTGNDSVYWELVLGQAISGTTTFNDVNGTYSCIEYNTAGTISGSPAIVILSGYTPGTNQIDGMVQSKLSNRYPMTLDAAGANRSLGTVSLLVTGIGAPSAVRAALDWIELR